MLSSRTTVTRSCVNIIHQTKAAPIFNRSNCSKLKFSTSTAPKKTSAFSTGNNVAMAAALGAAIAGFALYSRDEKRTEVLNKEAVEAGSLEARLTELEKKFYTMKVGLKNRAFVFIKPHAVTAQVEKLVEEKFEHEGVKIVETGEISGEVIDKNLLIDTHYGAIASKAVKTDPKDLVVGDRAKKDFEKMSGKKWEQAIAKGEVKNAKTFCAENGLTGDQLDAIWSKLKKDVTLIKFGGGFYCGAVELNGKTTYVINGFYMSMRSKFTQPDCKIKYYVVEFSPDKLCWADFRGKILGGTDPKDAAAGSLRRSIFDQWQSLGLKFKPNTGDNGVHASASPFEAFAERCNWLKNEFSVEGDEFGKAVLLNGVKKAQIEEFMQDASVKYDGKQQSIFDLLEDLDSEDCFEKLIKIAKSQ